MCTERNVKTSCYFMSHENGNCWQARLEISISDSVFDEQLLLKMTTIQVSLMLFQPLLKLRRDEWIHSSVDGIAIFKNSWRAQHITTDRTFLHTLSRNSTATSLSHTRKNETNRTIHVRVIRSRSHSTSESFAATVHENTHTLTHTTNARLTYFVVCWCTTILFPPFFSQQSSCGTVCCWYFFVRSFRSTALFSVSFALIWRRCYLGCVRRTLARTSFRRFRHEAWGTVRVPDAIVRTFCSMNS